MIFYYTFMSIQYLTCQISAPLFFSVKTTSYFWKCSGIIKCKNQLKCLPSLLVLDCCRFLVRESVDLIALHASARNLSARDFSRSEREKFALLDVSQSCVVYREYKAFLEKEGYVYQGYMHSILNNMNI